MKAKKKTSAITGLLRKRIPLIAVFCLAMVLMLSNIQKACAELEEQPDNKSSVLVDNNGDHISDAEFAKWIDELLEPDNVRDAKFLFQQCFGGGMLDDIKDVLGSTKWVGGSASKHNEIAIGQVSTEENAKRIEQGLKPYGPRWVADPPENWWIRELDDEMVKDKTLKDAIDAADANDPAGDYETGQSITGNGGETITLNDPSAASHHAIIWGGSGDMMSIYNDVDNIRNALINQWGPPNGGNITIKVLFGDGEKNSEGQNLPETWNAKAATKANLKKAIEDLNDVLDPNEQFFIATTGHGDVNTVAVKNAMVPSGGIRTHNFDLSIGERLGMDLQEDNISKLKIEYSVAHSNAYVYLNDYHLGTLNPALSYVEFNVNENILAFHNSLKFENNGTEILDVNSAVFCTGSIGINPLFESQLYNEYICSLAQAEAIAETGRFTFLPGDLNQDCVVNFHDVPLMLESWLNCTIVPDDFCP